MEQPVVDARPLEEHPGRPQSPQDVPKTSRSACPKRALQQRVEGAGGSQGAPMKVRSAPNCLTKWLKTAPFAASVWM